MNTSPNVIDIAAIAGHAALNGVRLANNEPSLNKYEHLTDNRKNRYRAVVKMLIANPNLSDASIHEFWVEKTNNEFERSHPNRVTYDDLHPSQRNKILAFKLGVLDIIRVLAN